MPPRVQIKGVREGLLVSLGEGDWPEVKRSLLEQLDQQKDFLHGAKIFLDVGSLILHAVELSMLRDDISERGIMLWGVLSNSPTTEQTAQTLGLATRLSRPSSSTLYRSTAAPDTTVHGGEAALLVKKTLRSGFSLKHDGHVIVIGDVNPGAEICAGGSVIVWGRLRGTVQAGANGDLEAVVCALDLQPMQLRIADHIAVPPSKHLKPQPEMARLVNGRVVAESWNVKRM